MNSISMFVRYIYAPITLNVTSDFHFQSSRTWKSSLQCSLVRLAYSVVGIVTRYGFDGLGSNYGGDRIVLSRLDRQ